MLRAARAALLTMVPAELLLRLLPVSGVPLPGPLVAVANVAALALLAVQAVVGYRQFRDQRRGGAGRGTALRAVYGQFVPEPVRRIMGFDLKGMVSLVLWATRRRHGVPSDATAVSYSGAQSSTMVVFLVLAVAELVAVEAVLRAIGAPAGLRTVLLLVDGYGILIMLSIIAACITRPHVVSADEVRIRYGAFFDLRVPREQIAEVRRIRNYNESGAVKVNDERLAVAVSAQTNVLLELTGPVTVVRPLGRRCQVRTIRFFADDPAAAINALHLHREYSPKL
ncbi:hypothetical protein ACNTMW_29870 [Planosporangium sp. 12N6]|uniref:hypothetical protein n=1 Tax=Planosporangium spinosum TaxID=3402278 RepID=UPI003CF15820